MWKNPKYKKPLEYQTVPLWIETNIGKKIIYGYKKGAKWFHTDHTPIPWKVLKWFDVPDPGEQKNAKN